MSMIFACGSFDRSDFIETLDLRSELRMNDPYRILYSLVVTEFSLWTISGSTESPPVIFQVDNLEITPSSVSHGDTTTIAGTANNLLAEPDEYIAVLWVNGSMNNSQTLTVGPGTGTSYRIWIYIGVPLLAVINVVIAVFVWRRRRTEGRGPFN